MHIKLPQILTNFVMECSELAALGPFKSSNKELVVYFQIVWANPNETVSNYLEDHNKGRGWLDVE